MLSKSKISKLINVSNNRFGIDTHYVSRDGKEGKIVGSKKESVIKNIQEWFETMEMTSATIISGHGTRTVIDFENRTINGVKIT